MKIIKEANLRFLPNYTIIITSKELTRVDTEIDVSIGKTVRSQYVDFLLRVKIHIKTLLQICLKFRLQVVNLLNLDVLKNE